MLSRNLKAAGAAAWGEDAGAAEVNMKMKKNTLYIAVILILVVAGIYLVMSNRGDGSVNVDTTNGGEAQKVVLSIKNFNYYPQEIRVKAGQPVEISLDSSVTGCFRDFTIRDFGIHKNLKTPQDSVTFTPTKPGRYTFACSMGMGTGTLIVE